MQKAVYRNKMRFNKGILDKIWAAQHQSIATLLMIGKLATKCNISSFGKSLQSISVRNHGFNNENKKRFMFIK